MSEILSNEPGGRVRLEWIEIYNTSDYEINIGDYLLSINSAGVTLPENQILNAYSFAVLARQALPDNGSDSFEAFWGDSSGIWGDAEFENYPLYDMDFALSNTGGTVAIRSIYGGLIDSVSWNSPSEDGRSIEKSDVNLTFSDWHDCFDPSGSTPGHGNSEVPSSGDEKLVANVFPEVISYGKSTDPRFEINIIILRGGELTLDVFDESGHRIRTLLDAGDSNVRSLYWDLKDDSGKGVPPGLYMLSFRLDGLTRELKIVPIVIAP